MRDNYLRGDIIEKRVLRGLIKLTECSVQEYVRTKSDKYKLNLLYTKTESIVGSTCSTSDFLQAFIEFGVLSLNQKFFKLLDRRIQTNQYIGPHVILTPELIETITTKAKEFIMMKREAFVEHRLVLRASTSLRHGLTLFQNPVYEGKFWEGLEKTSRIQQNRNYAVKLMKRVLGELEDELNILPLLPAVSELTG